MTSPVVGTGGTSYENLATTGPAYIMIPGDGANIGRSQLDDIVEIIQSLV